MVKYYYVTKESSRRKKILKLIYKVSDEIEYFVLKGENASGKHWCPSMEFKNEYALKNGISKYTSYCNFNIKPITEEDAFIMVMKVK